GPRRARRAPTIGSRFSRSSYVGRQTVARMRGLDGAGWVGTLRMIAGVAATLPRNSVVVEQLELLADLLELEGQESFRVLAYRRGGQRVNGAGGAVAQLGLGGRAK